MTNGQNRGLVLGLIVGGLLNIIAGLVTGFYFHYADNITNLNVSWPFWIGLIAFILLLIWLYNIYRRM